MTESEIISVINAVANNIERGLKTAPDIASAEMRQALSRLYTIGYDHGIKVAESRAETSERARQSRQTALEREIESLQSEIEDYKDRAERQERAAEKVRAAIEEMGRALAEAESELD